MTEPDVALTDYALALLCSWLIAELSRMHGLTFRKAFRKVRPCILESKAVHSGTLQKIWMLFFASVLAASMMGGTVHGFFLDDSSLGAKLLWPATLLATGITSMSVWLLAGTVISGPSQLRKWWYLAGVLFAVYAVVVLFYSRSFLVVILNSLPATLTLLAASAHAYWKTKSSAHLWLIAGIFISIGAALIQQIGIALHPVYFTHNSTYHLVQGIGFWTVFQSSKRSTVSN